jgi:DnaJ-class molecular chaperone
MNYYNILGVPKSASMKEIKSAFIKLVNHYSDDNADSMKKLYEISKAYNVLGNLDKRSIYDSSLSSLNSFFQGLEKNLDKHNYKFSKVFSSSSYIDANGHKESKTIKKINNNGKIYAKEVNIDGNKKTTTVYYPDGKVKRYDSNNRLL